MYKYVLSNKAAKDLSDIWNYTYDTWSEKQADKYYNDILKQCSKLGKNPEGSKSYSNLMQKLRGSKINKHIIFFRVMENNIIEVARILHEQMDLKHKLRE